MSLEVANYLADLVATNPAGSDKRHQGDDHIRLLKAALQATFPNASSPRYFWAAEVDVASAGTCNILGAASEKVRITGTTTITSFGTGTNRVRYVRFAAALTLTHNATSLILPGAANIAVGAGDTCIVVSDASSNCRVYAYQRAGYVPPTVSTFMATVLDDVDAATARATLGLTIGTNVQAFDATLSALAAFDTNGLVVQTATNTFVGRTLGSGHGITVTNGDGVSGAPSIAIKTSEDFQLTGSIQITRSDANPELTLISTDSTSTAAPRIVLRRAGGSPADSDQIGQIVWTGEDSALNSQDYASLGVQPTTVASLSEAGRFVFTTTQAGSSNQRVYIGLGLYTVSQSDMGANTINATTFYQAGTALASLYQPLDTDLTALAGISSNGFLSHTGSGTAAARTFSATSPLSITNGDGVSGSPALSLLVNVDFAWTVAQTITSTGATPLTITSTIATGTQAPTFDLVRDITGVTGENTGVIRWRSKDTAPNALETFGSIGLNIVDATSGSEDARFVFSTKIGGAGNNGQMYLGAGLYSRDQSDQGVNTLNFTTLYENAVSLVAKYAALNSANTFAASQVISQAAAGTILTLNATDAGGAIGPVILMDRISASAAATDILGGLVFQGRDASGGTQQYGGIKCVIDAATNLGEYGSTIIQSAVLGSVVDTLAVGDGVKVGSPSGGYKGAGTLNAVGLYDDNVLVSDFVFEQFVAKTAAKGTPLMGRLVAETASMYDQKNYAAFWKEHRHLPSMPSRDEIAVKPKPIGALLSGLWQAIEMTSIHVDGLEDRILALEQKEAVK